MRSLKWITLALSMLAILAFTGVERPLIGRELHLFSDLKREEFVVLGAILSMLFATALWAALQRYFFRIDLSQRTLSISKGVMLRHRWSFPTEKITALRLGRDLKHLFLGLYFLDIVTPGHAGSDSESHFARVEGLNLRSVIFLQRAIRQSAKHERASDSIPQEFTPEFTHLPTYSESVAYM